MDASAVISEVETAAELSAEERCRCLAALLGAKVTVFKSANRCRIRVHAPAGMEWCSLNGSHRTVLVSRLVALGKDGDPKYNVWQRMLERVEKGLVDYEPIWRGPKCP